MTRTAQLTQAELRRALKVADAAGKRLAVRPDGTLVFEEKTERDGATREWWMPGWPTGPVKTIVF